ncbi:LOW QUALITY PROTEIN: Golgi to ER traffic protein 4 homolog [Dermatophagoides pteronyssinus]|uniref:LOW QUALITY PROTEIN: Golgi to ER traffic protein 4 homolog n=1 Tax=Dermatophagoides pteronyssinus TaxID=6956 RepID=UPI003F66DC2B
MQRRLLQKLNERFDQGDYYEAHQIYRTIYYRLVRENKFAEIYNLLYEGSIRLFDKGEPNSGSDLALLLADLMLTKVTDLKQLNQPNESKVLDDMTRLFSKISNESPERLEFISKLLKIKYLTIANLRKRFAQTLWSEKNYSDSRLHFLYSSDNGDNCALMLIEYQCKSAYSNEIDLMIAQFVLQVLCVRNQQLAHNVFLGYTMNHPKIRSNKPPFTTPLLNFLFFLIMAIDHYPGKSQLFEILCNLYDKSLCRDPCYKDYLQQIGQIYFGLEKRQQQQGGGGIFSNLIQSIFDMSADDDNDQSQSQQQQLNFQSSPPTTNQEVDLD